jgi:hypothetical protein
MQPSEKWENIMQIKDSFQKILIKNQRKVGTACYFLCKNAKGN